MLPRDGARVRLRRLRAADLPHFQAYRGDAELGRWQGWRLQSDEQACAFIAEMAQAAVFVPGAWCQLAVAERESDTLIGDIGLHLQEAGDAVAIGYTLARAAQGRGLAAEAVGLAARLAFEHSAAARIVAVSDTRNTASLRLLERLQFRRVTTLDASFRGEPCQEQHWVLHRSGRVAPVLRDACAADAPAVAALLIEARRELMPYAPSAHGDDDVRGWVAGTLLPAGGVTVALHEGRVVGVLAVAQRDGMAWIEQLSVLPAHVGQGIGAALLAHAMATLPRPLRLYTFQANVHARAFYERKGFVAVQFGNGAGNEEHCPDVLYELGTTVRCPP